MKRIMLLTLTCMLATVLFSQKMKMQKFSSFSPPRLHPYTPLLRQAPDPSDMRKNASFERLLVILVDFQFESPDDPNTTGYGKFQLSTDPNYRYPIGAPPHNRQYFEANMEAMKYYYRAVSAESFQLQYDVYPKNKAAYTLPHPMGYYSPAGASSEVFVSRMEEYFKTSFETADQDDPEINFGSYSHYMIIHAGSDWQHDVNGDTPSDIPSFYIRVSEGKEAVVDGGAVLVSHACNVPATISQDFSYSESKGQKVHSGYGALNSVLAHEFGHSLGFVDLYNVADFRPMVGSFDIMDSGGAGLMLANLPDVPNEFWLIEGTLPVMPGAFSRQLVFGDFYKANGYMKDLSQLPLYSNLNLHAVSAMQNTGNILPQIIKIPLNTKEYILVENRNVDPDNDGATALFGALNSRVVLYPVPRDENLHDPTYEYDFMLPSFTTATGAFVGGGVMVWHVNESILYDEGVTYSDGTWVNNFNNNSVNTRYNRRGVKVIEADGLTDLGNDYSMYWTGTPYEYFHAKKPVLDVNGNFVSWSNTAWKPKLNSTTIPSLLDSYGLTGLYGLSNISNPAKVMSLQLTSGFFDTTKILSFASPLIIATDVINSGFNDFDLPVINFGRINLQSNVNNNWQDIMGDYYDSMVRYDYPPQKADNNTDGYYELVVTNDKYLRFLDFADIDLTAHQIVFPDVIGASPLTMGSSVITATRTCIYKLDNFDISQYLSLEGIVCLAAWDGKIAALGVDFLAIIDASNMSLLQRISLPELFGNKEPVVYQNPSKSLNYVFLMSNAGNLYRYDMGTLERIFANHTTSLPGEIALSKFDNISPVLFFGIENKLYALKADGSLVPGFPVLAAHNIATGVSPKSMCLNDTEMLYYPLENSGYLAVNAKAKAVPEYSLTWNKSPKQDYLYYHAPTSTLYWYYPDSEGKLFINSLSGLTANPILYSGFRNSGSGSFVSDFAEPVINNSDLSAFIFPNPVKKPFFTVRLSNAVGDSKMRIHDISGALVASQQVKGSANNPHDFEMDSSRLGAGVYILSIDNNGKQKRFKFAVEK